MRHHHLTDKSYHTGLDERLVEMEADRRRLMPWLIAHEEYLRRRGRGRQSEDELEARVARVLPGVRATLAKTLTELEDELAKELRSRRLARETIVAVLADKAWSGAA